jgi:NAD(P)-dependent dehydrogenase (short-subunit alcohol dehydrogenase family)
VLLRLVSEGGIGVGVDLNQAGLRETVEQARGVAESGGRASYTVASVAEELDVREAVRGVVGREGRLDVLVNMAGVLRLSKTIETSLDQFRSIINVNLIGTFLFCREALPHLLKTRGNIVNAASTSASFGHPYMAAYSASKGGIASLTQSLAWEYIREGVRVNAVAPGGIMTPMAASQSLDGMDASLFQHLARPDQKLGLPENVAAVVAMLASDDGAFMTGEVLKVDGGVHS